MLPRVWKSDYNGLLRVLLLVCWVYITLCWLGFHVRIWHIISRHAQNEVNFKKQVNVFELLRPPLRAPLNNGNCGERLRAPNSNSDVSDQQGVGSNSQPWHLCPWARHCFVLRMGRKAVGPMGCVMHVKEPSALIEKRRGSPRCSWLWLLNAP